MVEIVIDPPTINFYHNEGHILDRNWLGTAHFGRRMYGPFIELLLFCNDGTMYIFYHF